MLHVPLGCTLRKAALITGLRSGAYIQGLTLDWVNFVWESFDQRVAKVMVTFLSSYEYHDYLVGLYIFILLKHVVAVHPKPQEMKKKLYF